MRGQQVAEDYGLDTSGSSFRLDVDVSSHAVGRGAGIGDLLSQHVLVPSGRVGAH